MLLMVRIFAEKNAFPACCGSIPTATATQPHFNRTRTAVHMREIGTEKILESVGRLPVDCDCSTADTPPPAERLLSHVPRQSFPCFSLVPSHQGMPAYINRPMATLMFHLSLLSSSPPLQAR